MRRRDSSHWLEARPWRGRSRYGRRSRDEYIVFGLDEGLAARAQAPSIALQTGNGSPGDLCFAYIQKAPLVNGQL